jgi:LmbE family N-acetylglucosaminyl deacetylase
MTIRKKIVLVVAAHPDDEWLGSGGTALRHIREGDAVYMAVMGEGVTARFPSRGKAPTSALSRLRLNARQAARAMGVKDLFLHGLPDNRFDTVPLLDLVKKVEGLVGRLRPDVVYTHHQGDLNMDHALVARAVVTATRPMLGQSVRSVLAFEIPSATEWAFRDESAFRPHQFVNISATLSKKLEALSYYRGEMRDFPHPRSPKAVEALARWRGATAGFEAAEAFELVREVR